MQRIFSRQMKIVSMVLIILTILGGLIGFTHLPQAQAAKAAAQGCESNLISGGNSSSYGCTVTGAKPCLNERDAASFAVVACLPNGTGVDVVKQLRLNTHPVHGSVIWDELLNGDIVSDNYVNTGNYNQFSPPIPNDGSTSTVTPSSVPSGTPTATDTPSGTPTAPSTPSGTPIATATATTDLQPVGQSGGGWKLLFHDEFEGNTLNTTWATCYANFSLGSQDCSHNQGEQEAYTPQNVTEANGIVTLTAKKQTVDQYPYTSGMISSGPSRTRAAAGFSFTYGYAEMRVQIPAGQGLWPAFWLLPTNGVYPPEIDIFEILGNTPSTVHLHYHYPNGTDEGGDSGGEWNGPDFSAGWHTFAIDWEPGRLIWYVDGLMRRTYINSNVSSQAMYMIANLAVGGDWPGAPDAKTPFPAAMQIDYIRVWQEH